MKISFKTAKLQKIFNSEKEIKREYGQQANKIMIRMKTLEAAVNLAEIPAQKPDRRHQLKGDRKHEFAVDLNPPYRLVFTPSCDVEFLPDGGIDLTKITHIIILSVEDYHGE